MFSSRRVRTAILTATLVLTTASTLFGHAHAASADDDYDLNGRLVDGSETMYSMIRSEQDDIGLYDFELVRDDLKTYWLPGDFPEIDYQTNREACDPYRLEVTGNTLIEIADEKQGDCEHYNSAYNRTDISVPKNSENTGNTCSLNFLERYRGDADTRHLRRSEVSYRYRMNNLECLESFIANQLETTSVNTGNDKNDITRNIYEQGGYFRTISLAAGSYSRGSISISTTVAARQRADKLGVRSISLQRYQNNRWMTIKTWTNAYRNDTSRFSFRTTENDLTSGSIYRIVVTYTLRTKAVTATITRTSSPLICR